MSRKLSTTTEGLAGELARLPRLDRAALIEHWHALYGTEPPHNISRPLLLQAVAYRLQEKTLGGLKPATQRFLEKTASDNAAGLSISMPIITVKAGTRLLREWHGVTYEVVVAEDGVMFQGKQYRSLSEVARIITGTRWSGPMFFGLKKQEAV